MKYKGDYLKEISFPLGGIGTGSVGLSGDGRLADWEIFNKPSKGSVNGYSHFAVRAIENSKITAAVLNGDIRKDFMGQYQKENWIGYGFGPNCRKLCGFPHFKDVVFKGEFPLAEITFKDDSFPGNIKMEAFNPFIPLDALNSSIPAAFFEFEVKNTSCNEIKYQFAFSVANPYERSVNESGLKSVTLSNNGCDKASVEYGDLTIATDCEKAYTQTYWYRGAWRDGIVSFWNEFSKEKKLSEREYNEEGSYDTATVIAEVDVKPNEKKKVRFVLSWNVPGNYNYWDENKTNKSIRKPWKNYYATMFENSKASARYSLENWSSLYKRTLKFKNLLHNSTLPQCVIDAASANLAVLKSPTVLRLEDGSFYGWEGLNELEGSCEGTCQHVWNYAYALCFLFPQLERSIRDMEFKYSTDKDGRMGFRIMLPLGRKMTDFRACLDGQMGAVLKCYREWKISGDNKWLKKNWNNIKKVLEYAWAEKNDDCWDRNKDGVLEGRQHHTLDMELFGPSSWLEGMYLAALKAASEMAEFLGDKVKKEEYKELFNKGYSWTKENLFNGRYFIQKLDINDKNIIDKFCEAERYWNDEIKEIKYQIAEGSSIDQVLAQWHADILGLGYIFDEKQLETALKNMFDNNFKESVRDFVNPWRIFSVNDESGSVICDYPDDVNKPKIPIPYCEETMTGFEYSFAGILLSQGKIEEGLKVVSSVRNRFDGKKRNPWNEFECGSNYARSMASYALIPILSGFEFDMPKYHIGFNPYKTDKFKCLWSLADGWGYFEISGDKIRLKIAEGSITLASISLKFIENIRSFKIDGNIVDYNFENKKIVFKQTKVKDVIEIIF